jgi:serine/threonine-protein kinase SRPK3
LDFTRKGTKSKRYFDDDGQRYPSCFFSYMHSQFRSGHLLLGAGRYTASLEALLSRAGHSPHEIQEVGDFLSQMLVIDPSKRLSAGQLLEHSWLENVN